MSPLALPAPDAPASEWGRLAVSIPGSPACWADLDGVDGHDAPGAVCADGTWWLTDSADGMYLDVDHPATAGCLRALLGKRLHIEHGTYLARVVVLQEPALNGLYPQGEQRTLGRACIAAAAALGRWPGGSDTPSGQRAP